MQLHVEKHLPNLWKEGALFAFSGYDGPTESRSQFVATLGASGYSLLFHTPQRRMLTFEASQPGDVRIATGDVLLTELEDGEILAVYHSWHTLIGLAPLTFNLDLSFEKSDEGTAWTDNNQFITEATNGQGAVVLIRDRERWALAYGKQV